MKCRRFTEEQIISILREREAGMAFAYLSRRHGVSEQSIYNRRLRLSESACGET